MLFLYARRQVIAKGIEEIALALEIVFPSLAIDGHKLIEVGLGNFEPIASQARRLGYISDRCLGRLSPTIAALDDPAQYS
jgi:hypothetical protein